MAMDDRVGDWNVVLHFDREVILYEDMKVLDLSMTSGWCVDINHKEMIVNEITVSYCQKQVDCLVA